MQIFFAAILNSVYKIKEETFLFVPSSDLIRITLLASVTYSTCTNEKIFEILKLLRYKYNLQSFA